jgi:hypothetical protein
MHMNLMIELTRCKGCLACKMNLKIEFSRCKGCFSMQDEFKDIVNTLQRLLFLSLCTLVSSPLQKGYLLVAASGRSGSSPRCLISTGFRGLCPLIAASVFSVEPFGRRI